jgi:hypothetical protein
VELVWVGSGRTLIFRSFAHTRQNVSPSQDFRFRFVSLALAQDLQRGVLDWVALLVFFDHLPQRFTRNPIQVNELREYTIDCRACIVRRERLAISPTHSALLRGCETCDHFLNLAVCYSPTRITDHDPADSFCRGVAKRGGRCTVPAPLLWESLTGCAPYVRLA